MHDNQVGNDLQYTQEPKSRELALFLFMETLMRTIPSNPFICLLPSEWLQNNGKGTNRKVVDRTLIYLICCYRRDTILVGLLSAFYCPLCTHGCVYSLVSNTFWFKNLGMLVLSLLCFCYTTSCNHIHEMPRDFHIKNNHFSMVKWLQYGQKPGVFL